VTIVPEEVGALKGRLITGDVVFENYTAVGANGVVMPSNRIPEGTVIGALSFVPPDFRFEPWAVYAGVPIRRVGSRNRDAVRAQADALRDRLAARMRQV